MLYIFLNDIFYIHEIKQFTENRANEMKNTYLR